MHLYIIEDDLFNLLDGILPGLAEQGAESFQAIQLVLQIGSFGDAVSIEHNAIPSRFVGRKALIVD